MHISRQPQPLARSPAANPRSSQTFLLATDLQQSVLAELDRSSPNHFLYSPYGLQSGESLARGRLGFNGQLKENPTCWYHLGNGYRVYNPVVMRFHSPDRLSPFDKGGLNAYVYCMGDPVNYTDPTGQYLSAIFQVVQRGLLIALHTVIPAGMVFGPKVSGVALHATRFSLLGSVGTAAGAAISVAGNPVGTYISAAGTTALLAGAVTRGAVAVKTAYQNNVLWKTVRDNVKNIVGWSDSAKVVKPPAQPNVVLNVDLPFTINIPTPEMPAPPAVDARKIRE